MWELLMLVPFFSDERNSLTARNSKGDGMNSLHFLGEAKILHLEVSQ